MTMNRVQFQPGLSMAQFFDRYGSNDKCEAALIASRWPGGFACPACSASQNSVFRRQGRLYFQCSACRHQCSVISGTIFEASKLGLSRWFLAMHLLTQSKNNVAALELMRHLGVCYKTAWLIKHKLMEVMREREDTRQLDGRVEIDDAYLGGELSGGKRGRGSQNKVPFIAAVDLTPFPGVLRRSDSNLYQFGLRVPRDLLSHFPNAWAVRRSLGTADLREANDKARSLQAEWAARFESLRTNKPMPLDVVALRAKLLAYVERFLLTAGR